jgi:very-short-patch-repair endonuclease
MDRARGKQGVKQLREIIDDWDPQTALTRNEFEVKCRRLYRRGSLPEPLVNRNVGGFEVDFFWPEFGLIVEVDGGRDHNLPFGNERDKEKDSQLRLMGFVVLRLTWAMLMRDPNGSIAKIRAHMDLCRAEGRRADPGFATASAGH